MYVTSVEVIRAFRTTVIDDDWIRQVYQCRNGPCGPNTDPLGHRAECCFHPFSDVFTDGKVVYECCSGKCLKELDCDIRTTHITPVYHKKLAPTPRLFKHRRARFVCLTGNEATGPTGPVQGRELSQLVCSTYFFPMHIGEEASEPPDHTLQTRYDMSLDSVEAAARAEAATLKQANDVLRILAENDVLRILAEAEMAAEN
jgi:hypothetical protein